MSFKMVVDLESLIEFRQCSQFSKEWQVFSGILFRSNTSFRAIGKILPDSLFVHVGQS